MPWTTVARNVALPLDLQNVPRDKSAPRVEATLASVGLSAVADAYPRELSGGMKMRGSIARALVTEPAMLLMDEPFAALDEITRFKLNDELISLWMTLGKTIVFVTHDLREAMKLGTRIVLLAAGKIVADATAEEFLRVDHPEVKAFAAVLGQATTVRIELIDERLSTVQAGRQLHESGHNARHQRGRIDSVAAAVLLQSYLDARSPLPPLES